MQKEIVLHPIDYATSKKIIRASYSHKNHCLRCHTPSLTILNDGLFLPVTINHTSYYHIYLSARCSNCDRISLIEFSKISPSCLEGINEPRLYETVNLDLYRPAVFPCTAPPCAFDDNIRSVSPRFVEIYQHSSFMEQLGMSELYLFGFRKALEVLIKDYAIKLYPEKFKKIIKEDLNWSINLLGFENLKPSATIVRKLGNNGAHYLEKHEPYSNEDVKEYLIAVSNFISAQITAQKASKFFSQDNSTQVAALSGKQLKTNAKSPEELAELDAEIDDKDKE